MRARVSHLFGRPFQTESNFHLTSSVGQRSGQPRNCTAIAPLRHAGPCHQPVRPPHDTQRGHRLFSAADADPASLEAISPVQRREASLLLR